MLDHMNKLGILSSIQTRREVFTLCSAFQLGLLMARSLSIRTISPSTKEATMTSQVLLLPQPPSPTKKILPSRMAVLLLHNLPTVPFLPLTSGNGDNGEKEDDPQPSVSDMELEAEARRQFFKEQMEAEDAPQFLLLG